MNPNTQNNIQTPQGYSPPGQFPDINTTNANFIHGSPAGYAPNSNFIPMTNNQTADPNEINHLQHALKSNGQFVNCPYCRHQGVTRVNQQMACENLLCCICFGGVPWLLFQAVRSKDINCYNTDHFCARCGNLLSTYKAC